MTQHLLAVTLGPVQEFIRQARRTRDLWFGSHLLSELGRAAARALIARGAQLVFPALDPGDPELQPCAGLLRDDQQPPLSIANKLVAILPEGQAPDEAARRVREAVLAHWRESVADPVRRKCEGLLAPGIDAVWREQIDDFVEFLASWAPLDDYTRARRFVDLTIASRKNLRDFSPWRQSRGAAPKSSLDGARETVLGEPAARDRGLVRQYRIAEGEQLDAVGLVKRAGGEPEQFVPVVNIALADWFQFAQAHARELLRQLGQECARCGISRISRKLPCVQAFNFDASVVLPSRWRSLFEELEIRDNPEAWGKKNVGPLLALLSPPYPYVACLVADGDRIGRAIDMLVGGKDPIESHRKFSKVLSQFAQNAREIVEQQHRGALIYAGGDDVLAFVPLTQALECAEALNRSFAQLMQVACDAATGDSRPTLSVGIGVGHVMEGMGDLLELGRQAEQEAKRTRNALAVLVDMRSGGSLLWSAAWDQGPVAALKQSVNDLKKLPSRKIYEIAGIVRRLPAQATTAGWENVLAKEVKRALARAAEGEGVEPEEVGLRLDEGQDYAALRGHVVGWANRMLIARLMQRSVPSLRRKVAQEAA